MDISNTKRARTDIDDKDEHFHHNIIALNQSHQHIDDDDDDDDEEDADILNNSMNFGSPNKSGRKSRIPWDRKKNGDKNGLKLTFMQSILAHKIFEHGSYDNNIAELARELSLPTSPFYPYGGITAYAINKKLYLLFDDLESLDQKSIEEASYHEPSFVILGFEVMNQKKIGGCSYDKKRTPRSSLANPNSYKSGDFDDLEGEHNLRSITHPSARRNFVIEKLLQNNIETISDLFHEINVPTAEAQKFVEKSGFSLDKQIRLVLPVIEECMRNVDCHKTMLDTLGIKASTSSSIVEFLSTFYVAFDVGSNSV